MIETIYSNESQDGDRTSKTQTNFKMPKNIRQVGKGNTAKKIYVEDYVMTYIKQLGGGDFAGCKIAVLVGQCIKIDNCRNIFISGAVEVKGVDAIGEIVFTNDTWTAIYEDIKKYFVETEIVGWFIGGPGYLLDDEDKILKAHVDNFAGQDKTLLTYDNLEREEAFLNYENNRLCKLEGYYIYYEKNEEMQNFMIEHKTSEISNEADYDDRISREIRTVLKNKKPVQEDNKSVNRLMYAAGTLLAVVVLVVGAAMLGNYEQMKSMQDTLDYLTKNLHSAEASFAENDLPQPEKDDSQDKPGENGEGTEDASEEDTADEGGLDVEVVPGNVKPLDEDKGTQDEKDNQEEDGTSGEELADDVTDNDETADKPKDNTPNAEDNKEEQKEDKTESKADKTESKNEIKYYVVVNGDTLADISYKLYKTYTKVDEIMELNQIENKNQIYAGQKLIVP